MAQVGGGLVAPPSSVEGGGDDCALGGKYLSEYQVAAQEGRAFKDDVNPGVGLFPAAAGSCDKRQFTYCVLGVICVGKEGAKASHMTRNTS